MYQFMLYSFPTVDPSFIIRIRGRRSIFPKLIGCNITLMITDSAEPDEKVLFVVSHVDLHGLQTPFTGRYAFYMG